MMIGKFQFASPTDLVIFHSFLSSADCFQNHLFRKILSVSNSLDPDQAQHNVGPGLGPNCLQRLSADDKSGLRVNCD